MCWRSFKGVSTKIAECFKRSFHGGFRIFERNSKGISEKVKLCFQGVSRKCLKKFFGCCKEVVCFKGDWSVFHWSLNRCQGWRRSNGCLKKVLNVVPGCFIKVLRAFQGRLSGVLRDLQGWFKWASGVSKTRSI